MKAPNQLDRRRFTGYEVSGIFGLLGVRSASVNPSPSNDASLLLKAGGSDSHGGWTLVPQSVDQLGSSYWLALRLGIPRKDVVTEAGFPSAAVFVKEHASPRGVCENRFRKVSELLNQPGATRVS